MYPTSKSKNWNSSYGYQCIFSTTYFYLWDWFLCKISIPVYLFESIWEIQISVKKVIGGKFQICKNIVKNCFPLDLVNHWRYHDVSYVKQNPPKILGFLRPFPLVSSKSMQLPFLMSDFGYPFPPHLEQMSFVHCPLHHISYPLAKDAVISHFSH